MLFICKIALFFFSSVSFSATSYKECQAAKKGHKKSYVQSVTKYKENISQLRSVAYIFQQMSLPESLKALICYFVIKQSDNMPYFGSVESNLVLYADGKQISTIFENKKKYCSGLIKKNEISFSSQPDELKKLFQSEVPVFNTLSDFGVKGEENVSMLFKMHEEKKVENNYPEIKNKNFNLVSFDAIAKKTVVLNSFPLLFAPSTVLVKKIANTTYYFLLCIDLFLKKACTQIYSNSLFGGLAVFSQGSNRHQFFKVAFLLQNLSSLCKSERIIKAGFLPLSTDTSVNFEDDRLQPCKLYFITDNKRPSTVDRAKYFEGLGDYVPSKIEGFWERYESDIFYFKKTESFSKGLDHAEEKIQFHLVARVPFSYEN